MSQVGRIGGHLLNPNLERNGVDLSFKNTIFDDEPVLYLQVDPRINTVVSASNLEVGKIYKIRTIGTTNFTTVGAPDNNPGTIFSPIGPAGGTGDVYVLDDDNDPNPVSGTSAKVGIKTENPVYDLHVSSDIKTTNLSIGTIGYIDNIILNSSDTISSTLGPINVVPAQANPLITAERLQSNGIDFNDNYIGSTGNNNVVLDANGTGRLQLYANTTVNGNLNTTGSINLDGNLSAAEDIIIGDSPLDRVTIRTDLTQTIEPATDITYNLGSVDKRWANLWSDNWQDPDNLIITGMIISDQVRIDGTQTGGEIFSLQSNDNINLLPDTGITVIEDLVFEESTILNTPNTPISFTSTGIGYLRFMGDNGFVIPAGDNTSRPSSPEVGDTRWNSEEELLECFDAVTGSYITSIGPGDVVKQTTMEELGNIYSLILG